MSQRFSQTEAMIACWYLTANSDVGTDKEKHLITDVLMYKYDLWSTVNWDRFNTKWKNWMNDKYKMINHCKKILDDADYFIRVKTLAGMWAVAVDGEHFGTNPGDEWSGTESELYMEMEKALNVLHDDVKKEWKKI